MLPDALDVLVCDDHPLMRQALAATVQMHWPQARVVTAVDYPGAFVEAARMPWQLIISDLSMPGATPLDGIRQLRSLCPAAPVLVITANDDDNLLVALFALGVAGFVPKTSRPQVIELAIRLVLAGERYVPERVLKLTQAERQSESGQLNQPTAAPCPDRLPSATRLTRRQVEVLERMARGDSTKEIARDLGLSPATVKTHTAALFDILGVANRVEAIHVARERGVLT